MSCCKERPPELTKTAVIVDVMEEGPSPALSENGTPPGSSCSRQLRGGGKVEGYACVELDPELSVAMRTTCNDSGGARGRRGGEKEP